MLFIIVSSLFYIKEIRDSSIELKEYQKTKHFVFEKIYKFRNIVDTLSELAKQYVYTKEISYKNKYDELLHKNTTNSQITHGFDSILFKKTNNLPHEKEEYLKLVESTRFTKKLLELEQNAFLLINSDHKKAIASLFSKEYIKTKEKVMVPVDSFIFSLEDRTTKKIDFFSNKINFLYKILYSLIFVGFIFFGIVFWLVYKKIINPISELTKNIIECKKEGKIDKFSIKYYDDEIGFLIKNFSDMQRKIDENIKKLQYNAFYDFLTKILNRKTYFEISEEILKLSKRQNKSFSVLLIDIDYFKKINDTYGHLVGDEILVFVSKNITSLLRKSDIFGRFGGEEFIITLPDTKIQSAQMIAQKIKNHIENTPYTDKSHTISLSVSIGVSQFKNEKYLRDIIKKADQALYEAKNSGRNRVIVYEE
jgi:diguanylate cyclase (GGDEF)-like protein